MAARKRSLSLEQEWRDRIKTGEILARLNKNATGDEVMTSSQVKSAEILLRKVLPDLKQIEHSGLGGGAVEFVLDMRRTDREGMLENNQQVTGLDEEPE